MRITFQDPATKIFSSIIDLHHGIMFYMCIVVVLVTWMLLNILITFSVNRLKTKYNLLEDILESRNLVDKTKNITHNEVIEIVWTLVPTFVLILIAMPSFTLLYQIDEISDVVMTLKVIGHQWYWSYEYSDFFEQYKDFGFDSYMISEGELNEGNKRLLDVDNCVYLPIDVDVNVIITATDVLHSWAVPALGVKMDAVPGRLNQVQLNINRPGIFYGQCSEICGVNHGFMPIKILAVDLEIFKNWFLYNFYKN